MVAQIGCELKTPVSNTGLECQESGGSKKPKCGFRGDSGSDEVRLESSIDFLMGTSIFPNYERFWEAVNFVAGCFDQTVIPSDKPFFSGQTWQGSLTTLDGLKIGYNPFEGGGVHAWFCIPGKLFHLLNLRDGWRCLLGLGYKYRFKATRIDLKLRDYTRRKTPMQLRYQVRKGNLARVEKYKFIESGDVGGKTGDTLYLGSLQSHQFLRIYDSLPVHGLDAIDWELQARDKKAEAIFQSLIGISESDFEDVGQLISCYIASTVLGVVDFIDKKSNVRLSRQPRQKWWQKFVDEAGGQIRHSVARPSRTVERIFTWMERQVVTMMSALRDGMGRLEFQKWLNNHLERSRERFRPYHQVLVEECGRYLNINMSLS